MVIGGKLLLPCEVGVKTVLPAIKALLARTIVEKHGMKEKQAAFGWAKEDRATKKKFNDAFTRGLARGLKTGGK